MVEKKPGSENKSHNRLPPLIDFYRRIGQYHVYECGLMGVYQGLGIGLLIDAYGFREIGSVISIPMSIAGFLSLTGSFYLGRNMRRQAIFSEERMSYLKK